MKKLGIKAMVGAMAVVLALPVAGICGKDKNEADCKPGQKVPAAFEKLKALKGTWAGKQKMGDKVQKMTLTYEVSAGGSAVVETIMKGTPHAMTTVYFTQGDRIGMTHYCMLGNHPTMMLKKSDDKSMTFEMEGNQGISSSQERHMHGMTLTFVDPKHIKSEWVCYDNGKKGEGVALSFTKK